MHELFTVFLGWLINQPLTTSMKLFTCFDLFLLLTLGCYFVGHVCSYNIDFRKRRIYFALRNFFHERRNCISNSRRYVGVREAYRYRTQLSE
jgi:hypothetical protein